MTEALILIDLQRDFGAPDGAMAQQGKDITAARDAVMKAQMLAEAARATAIPVIFIRLASDTLCVPGTPGAEFIGPQPQADELVLTKSRFSAFTGTGLAETLRRRGIGSLVLAGLTTECCVAATAWAAFEEGFKVMIAADACAAYEPALHDTSLRALALSGVEVAQTSDIGTRWEKSI